tara:strand:- start:3204 stop:4370 length:1167 start_codon:yes stop_codon:yes gene_type:complete
MKVEKLLDVVQIKNPKPEKFSGEKRYYSTGNIDEHNVSENFELVKFENRPSRANVQPIENSVGFAKMKSTAKTLLVTKNYSECIFSTGMNFLLPSEHIISKYLYYYLISPYFLDLKDKYSGQGIMGGLSNKDLNLFEISVPSLQEQEKIVDKLDKVFNNINAILRNNDLKKKLYSDYFESIAWEEVIENQKFAKNPISDFFELDPSKSEILNENLDEVSFIPMADVDELVFEVESKQIKNYKQVKKGYKYFANGDFLLAKITPCFENGKMGQVNNLKNKIGFGSTEFIVHRSKGKILNEWIFLLYSNSRIRKKLASTMSGAVGHKRISKETISNLQICSPTIQEQKKIIDKLFMIKKIVDKKISIIDKEIVKYSSLKKSILNKEFSYE